MIAITISNDQKSIMIKRARFCPRLPVFQVLTDIILLIALVATTRTVVPTGAFCEVTDMFHLSQPPNKKTNANDPAAKYARYRIMGLLILSHLYRVFYKKLLFLYLGFQGSCPYMSILRHN